MNAYQARAKRRTSSTRGRTSHDDRTGDQETARGSAQSPDTGGDGGAQAGGGDPNDPNRFARNYNAMLSANNYFGQPHLYTQAHQNSLSQLQHSAYLTHQPGAWYAVPPGTAALYFGISQQQLGAAQAAGFYQGALIPVPAEPPPAPLPTEIKAGEIVAWRCWVARADGALASMTQRGVVWSQTVGLDTPALHIIEAIGGLDGGLGVHAWKTRAQAEDYAKSYVGIGEVVAVGTVELWGEVIEHDQGYRAQFAQIKEIVDTLRPGPGNPYLAAPQIIRAGKKVEHAPKAVFWPGMLALFALSVALYTYGGALAVTMGLAIAAVMGVLMGMRNL